MNILSKFFCKEYEYPPVGMFTLGHILILIAFIILIGIAVYCCRNIGKEKAIKLTKIIAIVVAILETIKITIALINGEGDKLDHWIPLYFCSMFIYAAFLAGFNKGKIGDLGRSFVGTGGIIAGAAFLVFPTTSFNMYPLFHYFCLYSMVYHSFMVFLGITYLLNGVVKINKESFINYIVFCSVLNVLAIIINSIPIYIYVPNDTTGIYTYPYYTNFMFLKRADNIPIQLVQKLSDFSGLLYTIIMFVICVFGTYVAIWLVKLAINAIKKGNANGKNSTN